MLRSAERSCKRMGVFTPIIIYNKVLNNNLKDYILTLFFSKIRYTEVLVFGY